MFIKPIARLSFLAVIAITSAFATNTNATAQDVQAQLLQDGDTSPVGPGTSLAFHLSSDIRDAGRTYFMLGSISGEGATAVGNFIIPMVFDVYTASDGVSARMSATRSDNVTSISWPTAETTGIVDAKMARTTGSSLKHHKSSGLPPPRPTTSTSGAGRRRFAIRMPSTISFAAPSDPIAHNTDPVSREVADHVALTEGFGGGQLDPEAGVKDEVVAKRQLRPVSPLIHPVVAVHPLLGPPVLGIQSIVNKTVLYRDVLGRAALPHR